MKAETLTKMYKNAKTRKDGIYALDSHYYSVKDGRLIHIGNRSSGEIFQLQYGFLIICGKVESYKTLKTIQKRHKEATQ